MVLIFEAVSIYSRLSRRHQPDSRTLQDHLPPPSKHRRLLTQQICFLLALFTSHTILSYSWRINIQAGFCKYITDCTPHSSTSSSTCHNYLYSTVYSHGDTAHSSFEARKRKRKRGADVLSRPLPFPIPFSYIQRRYDTVT